MKSDANRPWRKTHLRTALLLLVALLACAAVAPAQAATGGFSTATGGAGTAASSEAQAGEVIAFAPMRWAGATWYGPGLYGRHTACGQTLTARTIGVAHRRLPCGTPVKFLYRGRSIVAPVIDRGPYTRGNSWDLTLAAAEALNFDEVGADRVGYAVPLGQVRRSR
jgi:rare lipoprotein A (peptidoglycan hydrolase)